MVGLLFWNVGGEPTPTLIRRICDEHEIDLVALAEMPADISTLLEELNEGASQLFHEIESVVTRVRLISRLPDGAIERVYDDGYIFARRIAPPIGVDAILVGAHLPSKTHSQRHEQVFDAVRLRQAVEFAEKTVGHSRTIIMGDLNMNPFEDGLMSSDGLHAIMDRKIAQKGSRIVKGVRQKFMYNPMWRFFGNGIENPAGTYFGNGGEQVRQYWHILDQVLLRPDLLSFFEDADLKVIKEIDGTNLLNKNGHIDRSISDHLPIVASLRLERI